MNYKRRVEEFFKNEHVLECGCKIFESDFKGLVYCGSWNPLHYGHLEVADHAEQSTGLPLIFELSVRNCSKEDVSEESVYTRIIQFTDIDRGIVVNFTPNFVEKATLFLGCTFVLGVDTITRVGDLNNYFGHEPTMRRTFELIAEKGCGFLVYPRDGVSLDDVDIPQELRDLCISPTNFMEIDISSTKLRENK
jgi:hypothetical protein